MEEEKYYIRIGDFPLLERSGIWKGETKVGEEIGVSVYDACKIEDEWHIVLPTPLSEIVVNDLHNFMYQLTCEAYKTPKIFLVTGICVGKGRCNEPLLRNIKVIKELDCV